MFERGLGPLRRRLLILVGDEDDGTVLRPRIAELPRAAGRVGVVPVRVEKPFVRNLHGVVDHLDRLGMPGDPHLHLFVTRLLCLTAGVSHCDRHDARQLVEDVLHAPEAAPGERGGLRAGRLRTRVTEERKGREGREGREGRKEKLHTFAPTPTGQVTPVPPSPQ